MVALSPPIVRCAGPSDVGVVQQISADAYIPAYKAVIGAIPKPAFEDYTPRIQRGEVWILEVDREAVGVAVLEERADHLLVYSIAVRPEKRRKGYGAALLQFADLKESGANFSVRKSTNARTSSLRNI